MSHGKELFGALFILLFLVVGFTPITNEIVDMRSDPASESLSCATGIGQTACAVTLSTAHLIGRAAGISVIETSPGAGARSTLVLTNGVTLTVSGLDASTSYDFTVEYLTEKAALVTNEAFGLLLGQTQLLILVLVLLPTGGALVVLATR